MRGGYACLNHLLHCTRQPRLARKTVELSSLRFAVSEGAPNRNSVIEEMDERMIKARFKKRNVLDPSGSNISSHSHQRDRNRCYEVSRARFPPLSTPEVGRALRLLPELPLEVAYGF